MKRDSVDRMFAKRHISEWGSNMSQNVINQGVLIRFIDNPHVYQARENNCFITARKIWVHEVLFNE